MAMSGAAAAAPVTTLTPLVSYSTQMFAVYAFTEASDTLRLSMVGPNPLSSIFCNKSGSGCTASAIGQTFDLGVVNPGIVFGLTDLTVPNFFRTDTLGVDGYAHVMVSDTVDASNAAAVAAAYSYFGQGSLAAAAGSSIASLGATAGTVVTFVGWEDRLYGDYDYNDFIFAFTNQAPRSPDPTQTVPEPSALAMFGMGLLGFGAMRRRKRSA